ncbi:type IV secretory system conjugative DNA transfer family protein [Yoonia sp. R2-816]|uniref:type IV secretory system conjugative DNA transfer family protein n=1 Tax=Yoonia sp. R2-816 TaxID=3342638 RepID=UPI0037297ED3
MTRENIFTAFGFGFACILTAIVQVHFVGRARMEDMLARNIQLHDFVVYNWQLLLALLIATITGSVTMRSIRPSLLGPIFVGIAFFFFYSTSTLTGPLLLQLKASLTLANGFQVSPVMLKIIAWYAGWFLLGALGIRLCVALFAQAQSLSGDHDTLVESSLRATGLDRWTPVKATSLWFDKNISQSQRRGIQVFLFWIFSALPFIAVFLSNTPYHIAVWRSHIAVTGEATVVIKQLATTAAWWSAPALLWIVFRVHYRRFHACGPVILFSSLAILYGSYWQVSEIALSFRGVLNAPQRLQSDSGSSLVLIMAALTFFVSCCGVRVTYEWLRDGHNRLGTKEKSRPVKGLHNATWEDRSTIRRNMSVPGGIVLGELTDPIKETPNFKHKEPSTWGRQGKGDLLTIDPAAGNGHVLVVSETGGYKSSGIVIPNVLTYNGPVIVVDPKGEIYELTKAARRAMGFNPIKIGSDDGLDPFRMLEPLIGNELSTYRTIADLLVPRSASPEHEYFRERSVDLLTPLIYHFMKSKSQCIPADILKFLSGDMKEVLERAADVAALHADIPFVVNALERAKAIDERGFDSFIRPITNKLNFAEYPDTAAYVSSPEGSNKSKIALDPKTDIFINVSTLTLKTFEPLIRLLLGSILIGAQIGVTPEKPLARRLIIIDEAKSLGKLDILPLIRDEGRGYGLHLMMIYQTWGEVEGVWDREGAEAWMNGTEAKVLGWVQSKTRAEDLSGMLGTSTEVVETLSHSKSSTSDSIMRVQSGTTRSEQLREMPLLSARQISEIPRHGAIILTRDTKPIMASKAMYFTRSEMVKKVRGIDR